MNIDRQHIYVNGNWRRSAAQEVVQVTNPATEEIIGSAPAGCQQDLDDAVHAAHGALEAWRATPREERIAALDGFDKVLRHERKKQPG